MATLVEAIRIDTFALATLRMTQSLTLRPSEGAKIWKSFERTSFFILNGSGG